MGPVPRLSAPTPRAARSDQAPRVDDSIPASFFRWAKLHPLFVCPVAKPGPDLWLDATIALHLGNERFQIRIADGELAVARGEIEDPDATLETDQTTLLSLLRTRPLDEALGTGNLRLAGNRGAIDTSRRLFPLPEPIPTAELTS